MSQEAVVSTPRVPRPQVVSLAAGLMLLAAPALAVYSVPGMFYTEPVLDVYREAYAGTTGEAAVGELSAAPFRAISVVLLVLAAGLAALAVPVLRGIRPARWTVWLLGVLTVCAGIPQLLLEPAPPPRPPGAPSQAELERMLSEAVPAWLDPATTAAAAVMVVALVLVMALLALPRANDYFRRPPEIVPPPPPLHPRSSADHA
jgi:multisubunit Na+/H+ antiporter MnhB subunit